MPAVQRYPLALLRTAFSLGMLLSAGAVATPAHAADGTDELLSDLQRVPPIVIFVVDLSADMDNPCNGTSTNSCWTDTVTAIENLSRHYDFARFGVVGTASSAGTDTFTEIAPAGSSYADISAALALVSPGSGTTRNMSETIESIGLDYLANGTADGDDVAEWTSSPIGYTCTDTHIVVLAKGNPTDDDQIEFDASHASISPDITCDATFTEGTSPDEQCLYDQLVTHLYNTDWSSLSGTQRAVVHTIGLGYSSGSLADKLYANAQLNTVGEGTYSLVTNGDEILGAITSIFSEIEAGTYTRSSPVITVDGAYMIYDFYEMTGSNPLAQGHVRAYSLVTDPADPYYGQVDYTAGDEDYGGAVWDGGDLLVSRIVEHADHDEFDNDGIRHRDIYFWDDTIAGSYMTAQAADKRLSFDNDFVTAVGMSSVLDNFLDTSRTDWSDCASGTTSPEAYDLDLDCDVDDDDMQAFVDFARGLPTSTFRYLDMEHGSWKLQDSPYAVPVVVSARDGMYSMDTSYQAFLADLEADTANAPTIVLVPANDGMLHAFRLEDDPDTVNDEKGQELWGWIPGYLLQREHDTEWANHLIDQMFYGRTFMFDATPTVEDVWIDDGDGVKAQDGSEWHRIVVVSQGMGGPVTMALDITSTRYPTFLWEQTNTTDHTAMGYTTSRPTVFNVYDGARSHDQWVAMWGGGRAAGFTSTASGTAYYQSAEANLYMWNTGDTPYLDSEGVGYSDAGDNIGEDDGLGNQHPDILAGRESESDVDYDSDDNLENSYISAALAIVDVDGDGDGDVMYFPVTTAYTPTDDTNPDDGSAGTGPGDPTVPGSSWMYKAIVDTTNVDDLKWCQWYDPMNGTDGGNGVGTRPEVYYAATTSWLTDGSLGVYWGTGTPFNRDGTNTGYFFAMYDADPLDCESLAQPITCNGADGYMPLDSGEGMTSDPLVYAGVVYFTTYTPNPDRCENGTGRVYGIKFDDCSPGIDTNDDGVSDSTDEVSLATEGYTSGVTVGNGTVYYGTATPQTDGSEAVVETITATNAIFMNTATVAWMEMF
ncbi:MAG: hypothetical protein EXR69_09520 [Myxococcales bacterium]|nr:hypothetical protein [Myxococcales bacterium]